MYVRNLTGEEFPLQATLTHEMELNGNQNVAATIRATKVNLAFINDITEMWELVDFDDVAHKIIYAKKKGEGNHLTVDVKAIPLFFDTFDTLRIYEEYNEHMTAQLAFTRIFKDTGFNFVLVDAFDAVQWEGFGGGESRLETFKRALERYQAEFRISGNTVYLQKRIGRDTQFQYRYRLNASNITQENDASAMWTYAKGYGDYEDGGEEGGGGGWETAKLTREYTSPLAKIPGIGIRHAPPIKDGRIKVKEAMDKALKELVDESLKISVSADIHDLRRQGYQLAQPELGDRVFLIDERIGLDAEVRVVDIKIMRNWKGEVLDLNLTFGSEGITKRHQSNLQTAIKDITDIMAGRKKIPFSAYDNAVINATNALKGITSELTVPENGGLMAIDKNNPNNVVLFNAAGVGVSDDGGATIKNSITGKGVVAETIIGQAIIGVNLSSIDETGYFHVTGSNAEFVNTNNNRRVTISPDGLYGYNANNDIRFRADSVLVSSAALGTTNANVYLAAVPSGATGEARVVNYNDIPGDGAATSYRYLPLRASGFYGNYINVNSAVSGNPVNLYLRPLTNGEVRVTLNETTDQYRDIRSRESYANAITYNALYGDSAHLYVRSASEIRATRYNSYTALIPVRAKGFYGEFIDLDATDNTNASHIYVRPAGDPGELRVTVRGTTGTYRPVRASNYLLPSGEPAFQNTFSLLSMPPQENEATEIVKNINFVRHTSGGIPEFKLSNDAYVSTRDGSATDVNKTLGVYGKALQELIEQVKELKGAS